MYSFRGTQKMPIFISENVYIQVWKCKFAVVKLFVSERENVNLQV
jgi:hypothetical protein